jgi:uncharacterized repeat protein (TIGR03803 family)
MTKTNGKAAPTGDPGGSWPRRTTGGTIGFTLAASLLMCAVNAAAQAPSEKTIYSFNNNVGGAEPITGLILGKGGVLYGTSAQGGGGSVYSLSRASAGAPWTETLVYSLPATEENTQPIALAAEGDVLYVAVYEGGSFGDGFVFSLTPPVSPGGSWTPSVLYNFAGGSDGIYPIALIVHDGVVYGTTQYGGTSNSGVVFSLTPPAGDGGAWTEALLYTFTGGSDGGFPDGLTAGPGGGLYGTALDGGYGVVFSLTPPASPAGDWTERTLYSFKSGTDGSGPRSSVTVGGGGVLYGTTSNGGSQAGVNCGEGCGTVYSLTPPSSPGEGWSEAVLYAFAGGTDGAFPYASVVIGSGGVLYGTTSGGGGVSARRCNAGCGMVFSVTPPESIGGAWTETVLYAFTDRGADGSNPDTPLTFDGAVLYGTTQLGGTYKYGTAFQLKP